MKHLKRILLEMPSYTDSALDLSSDRKAINLNLDYFKNQNFKKLFTFKYDYEDFEVFMNESQKQIILAVKRLNGFDFIYNKVCVLNYQSINLSPFLDYTSKTIQVTSVSTMPGFRQKGFATRLYFNLVKRDFIIVSDSNQFLDGKKLWKRISLLSNKNKVFVYVVNTNNGFIKDSNGNKIVYNGENIDEKEIWKMMTIDNFESDIDEIEEKQNTLLLCINKKI